MPRNLAVVQKDDGCSALLHLSGVQVSVLHHPKTMHFDFEFDILRLSIRVLFSFVFSPHADQVNRSSDSGGGVGYRPLFLLACVSSAY